MPSFAAGEEKAPALPLAVPWAHALLVVWSLAPLAVAVNTNVNAIFTAVLTVFIGCQRSVKPTPPADSMSRQVGPYQPPLAPQNQRGAMHTRRYIGGPKRSS